MSELSPPVAPTFPSTCRHARRSIKRFSGATARIPRGEVRTYGELAAIVGRPRAARAVGTAMARNPVPLLVPCHRVVPSSGGVGNYGFGSDLKAKLLAGEGVVL